MNPLTIIQLPFTHLAGWKDLQQRHPSIATLAWCIVLPMSLLPRDALLRGYTLRGYLRSGFR